MTGGVHTLAYTHTHTHTRERVSFQIQKSHTNLIGLYQTTTGNREYQMTTFFIVNVFFIVIRCFVVISQWYSQFNQ